ARCGAVIVTSHGLEQRGWERTLEEHRLGRQTVPWHTRATFPVLTLAQSRLALTNADHVLCLSDEDREVLIERFGIAPGRVSLVHPAAGAGYAQTAGRRDYARCSRLLFFATWLKRKGIDDLVAAFTALADRRPDVTLTVLGSGVPAEVVTSAFLP